MLPADHKLWHGTAEHKCALQYSISDSRESMVHFESLQKGMVAGADGEWIYFDMVPEEHEVRTGAPEYTGRICVIGAELNEDKLAELFKLK